MIIEKLLESGTPFHCQPNYKVTFADSQTAICASYQLAPRDLDTIENLINRSMVKRARVMTFSQRHQTLH